MATIDEELSQLEVQLQQWKVLFDRLAARVAGDEPKAGSERQQRIDDLRAKHEEAQSTLAEVKPNDREKATADVDGTWSKVESKFFGSH